MGTEVTIEDVDAGGAVFREVISVPAGGYHDVRIDEATHAALNDAGRRPYLEVRASEAVMVMSTNHNDNWMASFHPVSLPEPAVGIDVSAGEIGCGESRTVSSGSGSSGFGGRAGTCRSRGCSAGCG